MIIAEEVSVDGPGFYDLTNRVEKAVNRTELLDGLVTLFIRHTSASLIIQENADPAVQVDLQNWMNRLAPENDGDYTHNQEGIDDMPAHIKSVITATSVSIPVLNGSLALGVWQGIFLWEHRYRSSVREVLIHLA